MAQENQKYGTDLNDQTRGLYFGDHLEEESKALEFDRSLAVIIGISDYSNGIPCLKTAANDARRLADILATDYQYEVRLLVENVTLNTLNTLLVETLPAEVDPNDRLLFYFAGHGIALDGDDGPAGYLVPQDARPEDRSTFLRMDTLHDGLTKLPCRHLLMILDCCFAGAMRWSSTRDLPVIPEVIHRERYERFIRDPAWQLLTSAAYDQKALDILSGEVLGERGDTLTNGHSPFALALFEALAGAGDVVPKGQGDGVITASELYLYLRDYVEIKAETLARHLQTPSLWPLKKHDKGEYIFLLPNGELNLPPAPELTSENNPYRGLKPFEARHADLFFGRTALIKQLAETVNRQPLTVVLGASGTGKSSLVKAGLLPVLSGQTPFPQPAATDQARKVSHPDRPDWAEPSGWCVLPPLRPTESPLKALQTHFDTYLNPSPNSSDDTVQNLKSTPVRQAVQNHLAAHPEQKLLLTIDQLEELITLSTDKDSCPQFLDLLAELLQAYPDQLRLVLTLRSDFEPQLAELALQTRWQDARFIVPPMSQAELREAIEGPASVRVLYFEPSNLVDQLIDEVIQTPGALPLLSFTLSELYIKYVEGQRDNRALTEADYKALGGVIGSLSKRATEEHDRLDAAHQATMRRIMLRMIAIEGGELARRRVPKSELTYSDDAENERVKAVLQQLIEARLIVSGGEAEEAYVEPAHDALVRAWDKLLIWKREADEYLPLQRRLTQAANDWKVGTGQLWDDDPRLFQARQLLTGDTGKRGLFGIFPELYPTAAVLKDSNPFNRKETEFVQQSIVQRARNQRRNVRLLFGFLIMVGTLSLTALWQRNTAIENEGRAVEAQLEAETQRAEAVKQRDEANRQAREARLALSTQLANQSRATFENDPTFGLLLAIEALNVTLESNDPTPPTVKEALWDMLNRLGGRGLADTSGLFGSDQAWGIHPLVINGNNRWLLTVNDWTRTFSLWDLTNPDPAASRLIFPDDPLFNASLPHGDEDSATPSHGALYDISNNGRWFMTNTRLWDLESKADIEDPLILGGYNVGFSSDNRWFVNVDEKDIVRLWDLSVPTPFEKAGRALEKSVTQNTPYFIGADWLITSPTTNTIHLWHLSETDLGPVALEGQGGLPVGIGPDGHWLVINNYNSAPSLWSMHSEPPTPISNTSDTYKAVLLSPDQRWLTTVGISDTIQLWDLTAADPFAEVITLPGPVGVVTGQVFSYDNLWLATSHWNEADKMTTIQVWSLSNPELKIAPVADTVTDYDKKSTVVSIDPKQRHVLISNNPDYLSDLMLWWWEEDRKSELLETKSSYSTTMSPDDRWLFVAGPESEETTRTGRLWDLSLHVPSSSLIGLPSFHGFGTEVVLSPGDRWLITKERFGGPGYLWDMRQLNTSMQPIAWPYRSEPIRVITYSSDHRWLMSLDATNKLSRWDLTRPNLKPEPLDLSIPSILTDAQAISPGGQWLVTFTPQTTDTVKLWNLDKRMVTSLSQAGANIQLTRAATFSPDGRWLIVVNGGNDGNDLIYLWQLSSLTSPLILPGSNSYSEFGYGEPLLALSPNSRWLATGQADNTIQLWNLNAENPVKTGATIIKGHKGGENGNGILALAFSPDSQLLASRSWEFDNRSLRIWDVGSNQPKQVAILNDLERGIYRMVFSTDNDWLLTTSDGAGEKSGLWNLTAANPSNTFAALPDWGIYSSAMTANIDWLITADPVQFLPNNPETLKAIACRTAGRNLDRNEWEFYFWGQPYEKTCSHLPPNPNYLASIRGTIADWLLSGDIVGAMNLLENPDLEFDIETDIVPMLISAGTTAAQNNEIEKAVALFSQVTTLNPTALDTTPQEKVRQLAVAELIKRGLNAAENGQLEEGLDQLQEAFALDNSLNLADLEVQARQLAAQYHRQQGQYQTQQGNLNQARASFQEALSLDETSLGSEPEQFIQQQIASGLVSQAADLASINDVQGSLVTLTEAQSYNPTVEIPASTWSLICRKGGILQQTMIVLQACEQAVKMEPQNPIFHDSRGLVRALSGDYVGAIYDFQFYIDHFTSTYARDQRQKWLDQLQIGENPFASITQDELEEYFEGDDE